MKKTGSLNITEHYKESFKDTTRTTCKELPHDENEDSKEPAWKCRYVVVLFGFLISIIVSIYRTVMGVAIVAMVNNSAIIQQTTVKSNSCSHLGVNLTEDEILYGLESEGNLMWSPKVQGYVLGSYFLGYIVGQVPAGILTERYGFKWLTSGALLAAAILTMLIPPLSWVSAFAVIVIQILGGLAQSFFTPTLTVLVSNWCPKTERGFFFSIVLSAQNLGPLLGYMFTGYVSEAPGGWPYAFYSLGILGITLAVCIMLFLAESPKEHPRISKAELNFILNNQERNLSRRRPKLPWRELLLSVPLHALSFASFGRQWALSQFFIVHSTFFGTILHFPIGQNGLFSALPFLLAFLFTLAAAWISLYTEQKKIVSVDVLRKFWVFISSLGTAIFLFGSYMAGCDRNLSVIFAVLCVGCTGFGLSGCMIISTDMSPTFAGTIQSIICTVGFTSSVLLPIIVGYLTDGNQTLEQWNKVFFTSIGVVMSSAIIFIIFGSAKLQSWNFVEERKIGRELENDKNNEVTKF